MKNNLFDCSFRLESFEQQKGTAKMHPSTIKQNYTLAKLLKIQVWQGEKALSNAQIKVAVQTLNQEAIMQNIATIGTDIGKEALDLFKHQIEQVKRL